MVSSKITVTIPEEIASQLMVIKNELKTSMSAIYKEALEYYLEKKEIERWEQGVKMASKDKNYLRMLSDLKDNQGDIYEY